MDERISWGQQVSLTNEEGDSVRRILSKLEPPPEKTASLSIKGRVQKNTGTGTLAHLHIQAHVYTSALAHWHTCTH